MVSTDLRAKAKAVLPDPRYRPVGGNGLLVEFGAVIDDHIHRRVLDLDTSLKADPFLGFVEAVPAYASLLVCFDPLVADHNTAKSAVSTLIETVTLHSGIEALRDVEVCYDMDLAPDLPAIAKATNLSQEAVINAHIAGDYKVFMYGFAPGYAYLAGVPGEIQLPRKKVAVRGVAAGSVIIAGPQCLVTTLTMPTGWWILGRSPTTVLDTASDIRPFLFDVGDRVRFRRISRASFDAKRRP